MRKISEYFENFDILENKNYFPREKWNEIILCISNNIQEISQLFFNSCIETINNSNYDITIVNKQIGGKADLVIKAYQLSIIIDYLTHYIKPTEGKEFVEMLFHQVFGKYFKKGCNFVSCYMELRKTTLHKKIYYFSSDIAKYICGYHSDELPTKFPCLRSYLSNGVPRTILARTDITACSLLIGNIVTKLHNATIMALAVCFEEKAWTDDFKSHIDSYL